MLEDPQTWIGAMLLEQMRRFRLITRHLIAAIIAIGLVIFVGCGDKGSGPKDTVIMPLKVGNSWLGTLTDYDSNGVIVQVDTLKLGVLRDTTISDEKWFIVGTINEGINKVGTFNVMSHRNDGIWLANCRPPDGQPCLLYKYPAVAGDNYDFGPEVLAIVTVLSTNRIVSVPAGQYRCYCYSFDYDLSAIDYGGVTRISLTEMMCLAPDVGLVKTELYHAYNGGAEYLSQQWELEILDLK